MRVRARRRIRAAAWWAWLLVPTATAAGVGCGMSSDEGGSPGFDVMEMSISEIATALDAGEVTSRGGHCTASRSW